MAITFNLIEKKTFNCAMIDLQDALDLDFKKMAEDSSTIESFEEIEKNVFKIATKEKTIMKKKLNLRSVLSYKVNKKKGLLHITTKEDETNNLIIDCRLRLIPESNNSTIVAVKLDASVDFGLPKLLNKTIKLMADKEIKNFLEETINTFDLKKIKD